ncbi:MAG: helix-turn-helix domain-containing protein [Oligoflexales bacterium]
MIRVHKIALNPNNKQRAFCDKSAGIARFSYNWGLSRWKKLYKLGEKPNEMGLRKELNTYY